MTTIFQSDNDRADLSRAGHQQRMTDATPAHCAKHPELATSDTMVNRRAASNWWAFVQLWDDTRTPETIQGRSGKPRPLRRSTERLALKWLAIHSLGGLTL